MTTFSKNFKFPMPDFNTKPWQQNFYDFVNSVDALLARYILVNNFVGVWQNSTSYTAGQRVVDVVSGLLFTCNVNHISIASPKLMSDDRVANPTFWTSFTFATQYRGAWATATAYATGDLVTFGQKLAIAAAPHTSGVFVTDQTNGLWNVLIDGAAVAALPAGVVGNADQIIRYDGTALAYQLATLVKASSAGILTASGISIPAAGTLSLGDATAKSNWRTAMGLGAIVTEALGSTVIDDPGSVGNLTTKSTVNGQAGAAYAVLATDRGNAITRTNAGAMADTIPSGATLPAGWWCDLICLTSSVGFVTLTPAAGTIDGLTKLILSPGQGVRIYSDGANLQVQYNSKIAQVVSTVVLTTATGTTLIPIDDTIPQSTEGDQYLTVTATPTNPNSTLIIEVELNHTLASAAETSIALFQDAGVNAIAAWKGYSASGTTVSSTQRLRKIISGGLVAGVATTFKVRAGPVSADTITMNGASSARLFGGVAGSSIVVTEILP